MIKKSRWVSVLKLHFILNVYGNCVQFNSFFFCIQEEKWQIFFNFIYICLLLYCLSCFILFVCWFFFLFCFSFDGTVRWKWEKYHLSPFHFIFFTYFFLSLFLDLLNKQINDISKKICILLFKMSTVESIGGCTCTQPPFYTIIPILRINYFR